MNLAQCIDHSTHRLRSFTGSRSRTLLDPAEQRSTLGDGFRVEARIVIDEAQDVLKVPTSALFRIGGESAVFQVTDGVVHQQKVKLGRQSGLEAEVLEGLKEGDQIVGSDTSRWKSADSVKLK